MIKPSLDRIKEAMLSKNYRIFETPDRDWNLNIVSIRNTDPSPKKFDDTLVVFHKFLGEDHMTYYPVTTDPSEYYLKNPMRPEGTAILVPGQYRSAYQIGIHKGSNSRRHKALKQVKNVKVYRDKNLNNSMNFREDSIQEGLFGINIHKGPLNGNWDSMNGKYSAGCTVFADGRHFEEFMLKCKFGHEEWGPFFTYTLLLESDL